MMELLSIVRKISLKPSFYHQGEPKTSNLPQIQECTVHIPSPYHILFLSHVAPIKVLYIRGKWEQHEIGSEEGVVLILALYILPDYFRTFVLPEKTGLLIHKNRICKK